MPNLREADSLAPEPLMNGTAGLLQEREILRERLAHIDALLNQEHDRKRRELTENYEREMAKLEQEAALLKEDAALHGKTWERYDATLRSIWLSKSQGDGRPHQDIAHQDIDIDVVMTHIDQDGDGVLSRGEVASATSSFSLGLMGCTLGVSVYLMLRFALRSRSSATLQTAAAATKCTCQHCGGNAAQPTRSCQLRKKQLNTQSPPSGVAVAC